MDFPIHKYIKSLRSLISGLITQPLLPPLAPGRRPPVSLRNRLRSPGEPAAAAAGAAAGAAAALPRHANAAAAARSPLAPPPPGPAPHPLYSAPPPSPYVAHYGAAAPAPVHANDAQMHAQAQHLAQHYLQQYMQQAGLEPHAAAAAAAVAAAAAGAGGAGSPPPPRGAAAALPPIGPRYVTPAVAQQLQMGGAQGRRNGDLGPAFALSAGFTPAPAYEHLYSADGQPMMVELPLGGR